MKYYTFARNFMDEVKGVTPYFARFSTPMPFKKLAFGCGVRFLPDSSLAEDNHTFEPKLRLGLFIGYHVNKPVKLPAMAW